MERLISVNAEKKEMKEGGEGREGRGLKKKGGRGGGEKRGRGKEGSSGCLFIYFLPFHRTFIERSDISLVYIK